MRAEDWTVERIGIATAGLLLTLMAAWIIRDDEEDDSARIQYECRLCTLECQQQYLERNDTERRK